MEEVEKLEEVARVQGRWLLVSFLPCLIWLWPRLETVLTPEYSWSIRRRIVRLSRCIHG